MQIIRPMPMGALGLGAAFTILWGVADPTAALAEIVEVEGEDYYQMGDGMDERFDLAQQRAIARATKAAAEKAGVYLESFSEVKMNQVTRDEVRAVTAMVLEVKDSKVWPETVGEGGPSVIGPKWLPRWTRRMSPRRSAKAARTRTPRSASACGWRKSSPG